MNPSKKEIALEIFREKKILRSREMSAYSVDRKYLYLLKKEGFIEKSGRGLYAITEDPEMTENHTLALACKRIPHGIICLLSALQFHHLTTQSPFEIWMAIPSKTMLPNEPLLPLRIVHFSGKAFVSGIENHQIEGVSVAVTNIPKTIADLFKYRNKIGIDVAVEALKEGWKDHRFAMNELWNYAKICRVSNVIRPYVEML